MLPTHLPASALSRILDDFAALIEKDCDPGTDPLMWLAGCDSEHNHALLPYEGEPEDGEELVLDPIRRLDDGEELAIRLHTSFVGEEMMLIDGKPYMPSGSLTDDEDEDGIDEDNEYYDFPGDMSFYALGVKREGAKPLIHPVGVDECSNPGGVFHRSGIAEFPKSFVQRIEAYLASLG